MLNTLTGIALAAALGISGLSFWGSTASGSAATKSFVAKDVTADILPPPVYLIEMRLVLNQAVVGKMAIDVASNTVIATIEVGRRPWNMAITPDGSKLYVANGRSGSVSVIDTASYKKLADITVGELPWGVSIR